jgi:hypothetical protein
LGTLAYPFVTLLAFALQMDSTSVGWSNNSVERAVTGKWASRPDAARRQTTAVQKGVAY